MTFADRSAPVIESEEYPGRWSDYIGQEPAKLKLQTAAKSARLRKAVLGHTLITGPAGTGKTALAVNIARELRKEVRVISGALDATAARMIFLSMRDGDVVFYDEAHTMMLGGKAKSEWWLNFLQDGCISGPLGMEQMPNISVIAATSEPERLPRAIRSRFMHVVRLDPYSPAEASRLVTKMSQKYLGTEGLPKVSGTDAQAIAEASFRNPRAIKAMLTTLVDVTVTGLVKMKGQRYDIDALLAYLDTTPDGLNRDHREYLRVLCEEFGGRAGARALEDRVGASEALDQVEQPLIEAGYIVKGSNGRMVTGAGISRHHALTASMAA